MSRGRWWLALGALWLAFGCWAVSSPILSAPDENVHLATLYCEAGKARCDRPAFSRADPCFAFDSTKSADCLTSPGTVQVDGVELNRYPGLFSWILAPLVSDSAEATVLRVRLTNATIAVGMMALSVWASSVALRPAVILAWTVCIVPLGMFLVPSVNPTAWTIVGAAGLWGPLVTALKDGLTWRRLLAVATATLLILGSRNEGWVLVAVVSLAVLGLSWPPSRRWALPGGLLAISALTALVRTNPAMEESASVGSRGPWEHLLLALTSPADSLAAGASFPAALGWLDTPLPGVVGAATLGTTAAVVMVGLGVVDWAKGRTVGLIAVLSLGVIWVGWILMFPSALQPRMALPLVIVGVGLALLPAAGRRVELAAVQRWVAVVALAVANCLALMTNSLRYLVGVSSETTIEPSADFPGPLQLLAAGTPSWSLVPIRPAIPWVLGTFAFVVYAVLAVSISSTRGNDRQMAVASAPPRD